MKKILPLLFLFLSATVFSQDKKDDYARFNEQFLAGVREWIMQNPRQAINHFEQCLQLNDTVAAVYYYLAAAYFKTGETELAQENIDKAMQLAPRNKWFRYLQIKIKNGRKEKDISVTIRPAKGKILSEKEVMQSLHDARQKLDTDRWYDLAKQTAEKYPFYPRVQLEAARAAFDKGNWKEAENFLLNGMDFATNNKALLKKYYRLLADVYQKTGNTAGARQYERLLKELSR